MGTHEFLQRWLLKAETDLNRHAHDLAARGASYEDYLIGVGRYRQLKSLVDRLQQLLKKQDIGYEDESDSPEDFLEPVEPTRRRRPQRPQQPRAWGGQ